MECVDILIAVIIHPTGKQYSAKEKKNDKEQKERQ